MKIKRLLWKIFSSTGVIWLWIDFLSQNRKYKKKNLIFYSSVCWLSLFSILFATSHSPIYGFLACMLLVMWVLFNTLYRISESLGDYFIALFWASIFVGIWFFLVRHFHILVDLQ